MSQHLLALIHGDLETKGSISYTRAQEIAIECKVKFETVRDEIRGAIRVRGDGWGDGTHGKEWDRIRIRAELDAAKKLCRDKVQVIMGMDGKATAIPVPDVTNLIRAIVADAQVCGLMGAAKAAKKDAEAHDIRPERDVWLDALRQCPRELLAEYLNEAKGMH